MPDSTNDEVAASILLLSVDLLKYSEQVRRDVLAYLLLLEQELVDEILKANVPELIRVSARTRRTEALLASVRKSIASATKGSSLVLNEGLVNTARFAYEGSAMMINASLGGSVLAVGAPEYVTKTIASEALVQGAVLRDWWAKLERDVGMQVATQIRIGLLAGESNDEIAQRIRGGPTGRFLRVTVDGKEMRIREYTHGILNTSFAQTDALVRTAAQTVANESKVQLYRDNQDILRGVSALVTLDMRTSTTCRGRSGGAWDFDGEPLPESRVKIKYPGPPPWHWRCRTILVPVLKSWKSILTDSPDVADSISGDTQASMDGRVPGQWNYEDWLKMLPEAIQRNVLGAGKYRLWKAGKISLSDMIDYSGSPITLADLESRYGSQ